MLRSEVGQQLSHVERRFRQSQIIHRDNESHSCRILRSEDGLLTSPPDAAGLALLLDWGNEILPLMC